MPFESEARLLLVLHAVVGAATVAVATHLVVWMRGWLKGRFARRRAVVRFAWLSLALFAATFLLGNLGYPLYKVKVRSAYLENPMALAAEADSREAAEARYDETSRVVLWFDIKEHWVAMGFILALACAIVLSRWNPAVHGGELAPMVLAMALGAAATTWLAAIIGLVTSSYRAIG
ncbi:MAG TPA: hypothetical protein VKZ63_04755 [Kofleriaceae bacterium]|nr:hypothetical protein [Kofleriaceae bacterium]